MSGEYPYVVDCDFCGKIVLTDAEYDKQMSLPDNLWECPVCSNEAFWDDDNYDDHYYELAEEHTYCSDCKTTDGCSCDEQYEAMKDRERGL